MLDLLKGMFRSTAVAGLTGTLSPVVTALSLVHEETPDPVLAFWAQNALRLAGVKHTAEGLEHLPTGNFVLAVNHQSHFDALVLFAHIRRHMRFIAKKELQYIPVFGYALKRAGNVFVDRSGSEKDKAKLKDSVRAVQERVSICFFAEGTRSKDGTLQPFKKGAAVLAIEAGVPLVPAALAGTHQILASGSLAIRASPAALVVGEPIQTEGLTLDDRDQVTKDAHARVSKLLVRAEELVEQLRR